MMTSMRLRLVCSFSFVDLLLLCSGVVQWWGGGVGGWGRHDDVHPNATCVVFFFA